MICNTENKVDNLLKGAIVIPQHVEYGAVTLQLPLLANVLFIESRCQECGYLYSGESYDTYFNRLIPFNLTFLSAVR